MRLFKRIPLLALAALAAVAVAAPASASAVEWTKEGEPLTEPAKIELKEGWIRAVVGSGMVEWECLVSGEITLEPGNEAEMTSFDVDPQLCEARGLWRNCIFTEMGSFVSPLYATEDGTVVADLFALWFTWVGHDCHYTGQQILTGKLVMTPPHPDQISAFTFDLVDNNMEPLLVFGETGVSPEGIFGISGF